MAARRIVRTLPDSAGEPRSNNSEVLTTVRLKMVQAKAGSLPLLAFPFEFARQEFDTGHDS